VPAASHGGSLTRKRVTGGVRAVMIAAMLVPGTAYPTARAAERGTPSEWVRTLLDRPLFSATRRPTAPLSDMESRPLLSLPRLTGIVVHDGERHAIFTVADAGQRSVVALEGGRVGSFIVLKIEPQQVIVSGPNGLQAVRTSFDAIPPIATIPRPLALLALRAGMAP